MMYKRGKSINYDLGKTIENRILSLGQLINYRFENEMDRVYDASQKWTDESYINVTKAHVIRAKLIARIGKHYWYIVKKYEAKNLEIEDEA